MADQFYYETALSLPMNGSNGATSFPDSSPRNAQMAAPNGGVTISTAQSVFGGASASFAGGNAYLAPSSWSVEFGTADFTVEFRVRFNTLTGAQGLINLAINNSSGPVLAKNAANQLSFRGSAVGSTTVAANQWYHVALVRLATIRTLYLDGTALAAGVSDTTNYNSILGVNIGRDDSTQYLNGFMDDVRITRGVARYTANFTPPAVANDTGSLPLYPSMQGQAIDLVNAPIGVPMAVKQFLHPEIKLYSAINSGRGRISGTTKVKGTPNYAVSRMVRLMREQDGFKLAEQWSDPVTGAYTFDNLDMSLKYTTLAYDYQHNYRAVVADNLTPDLMP